MNMTLTALLVFLSALAALAEPDARAPHQPP